LRSLQETYTHFSLKIQGVRDLQYRQLEAADYSQML
jgi:hypothetical protein